MAVVKLPMSSPAGPVQVLSLDLSIRRWHAHGKVDKKCVIQDAGEGL